MLHVLGKCTSHLVNCSGSIPEVQIWPLVFYCLWPRCGTLRPLAWAFPPSGVNYFLIMTVAMQIIGSFTMDLARLSSPTRAAGG